MISKLVLAAVVTASLPAAAAARDHQAPPQVVAWAPPAAYPAPAPAPRAVHKLHWRERQLAALRVEFRALEDERARFYAQPGVRRGQARRFERSYADRRAELERRWNALQLVAMR